MSVPAGPAPTDDRDPVRAVEIASARAWPATVTAGHAGWLLRATPGVERARSNSALTPPHGGARVADLDPVIAWLQAHTPRPHIMVSPLDRHPAIDAELARRGWGVLWDVDLLVARVAAAGGAPPGGVTLRAAPDAGWLSAWAACEGRTPADVQAQAEHVLQPLGARAAYALAGDVHDPAGVGIAVTVGAWSGIFAMATHPRARRRGVASAILRALIADAHRRGAQGAYLQVTRQNAGAQALYARHGFRRSHGYRTREAPAAASGPPPSGPASPSGSDGPPSSPSS